LIVYYGDDVAKSPDTNTSGTQYSDSWSSLVRLLSSWRFRNGLRKFDLENEDHLESDMARREHVRKQEQIAEGYYPMGKKASYNDSIPTVKMVIQHSRQIEEGEQRYRNVARIFLENQEGERFLAPTTRPGIAKVYARHIAEGGKPHDDRWNHIGSLCEEYQKMAGFVRATRGNQFNESAQKLVETGINHYNSLRESLSKLTGHRGYNMYFESWTPPLMEDESDTTSINELFVQETLDPRIESVMPILSKLHKQVIEMAEVSALSEWADSLIEGDGGQEALNPIGIPESEEIHEEEVEESALQAYLGNKKYGKEGMDALRKAGRDHAGKEKMANIRAKYDKLDEEDLEEVDMGQADSSLRSEPKQNNDKMDHFTALGKASKKMGHEHYMDVPDDKLEALKAMVRRFRAGEEVDEGLDANQKAAGQLGPTEKVKNNNIGKLVGANENFINTDVQAVVTEMDKTQTPPGRDGSGGDSDAGKKEHYGKIVKPGDVVKKGAKALDKAMDKEHKKDVKEGQEDLNALLRLLGK
jgi:hypothetical protein